LRWLVRKIQKKLKNIANSSNTTPINHVFLLSQGMSISVAIKAIRVFLVHEGAMQFGIMARFTPANCLMLALMTLCAAQFMMRFLAFCYGATFILVTARTEMGRYLIAVMDG